MKSDELQTVPSDLERKRSSLVSQMGKLYADIQAAMPSEAAAWMDQEVERRITENPDHVESLGVKKLAELKSNLAKLKQRLPQLVASEFKDKNRWLHHAEAGSETVPQRNRERIEPHPHEAFRNVISTLGALLDEYGLLRKDRGAYYSTWKKEAEGQFRYSINPGYGENSKSGLKQYFELANDYGAITGQIQLTQQKLSEAKAKELWDRA
jgi:hypothetical protein